MDTKELGPGLRRLRQQEGMTLRELSRCAKVSPASLSAIERGESSPTLASLQKILRALGTDFAKFFTAANASDAAPVFSAGDMHAVEDAYRRYVFLLPRRSDIPFEMVHETISPSGGEDEWETHDCNMGGIVLSGTGQLEVDGREAWPLHRGDAFFIRAGQRHRAVNTGRGPMRLLTVWHPPRY